MLDTLEDQVVDRAAWSRLVELGLPTKEWEVFRYVRLSDLYKHAFTKPALNTLSMPLKEGQCVFVDGAYQSQLSSPPKGVVALPLSQAFKTYGSFLHHRMKTALEEERDPFALLNRALYTEGLFLYIPPKSRCQLEIVHLITEHDASVIFSPRIQVFAGKEAEMDMCLNFKGEHLLNSFLDVALDERASVTVTTLLEENEKSWHFDAVRATLKRESRFKSYAVTNGGATSRQDYVVKLLEEGTEASLYGVAKLEERRHHHTNILMEHHAPGCRSLQHFKTVLSGVSRTSFEGKIYVHQAAQQTEAFQMNNNLILSKHASANSKPNLEIFADDVKASHGSTVGQLDEEQLFYLKARGIPAEMAKHLLVRGFCQEILDQLTWPHDHICRFT